MILKSTKQLTNTDIRINIDYQKNIQEYRKLLIPLIKQAKNKRDNATIRYDQLIKNNEI